MTTAHLNLKFTVAAMDAILAMAADNKTAMEIAFSEFGRRLKVTPNEIVRACDQAGVFIRIAPYRIGGGK